MATNGTHESSEPLEFPAFEEPLEFPAFEEPLEFPAFEEPQVLMCPFCRKEVTAGEENLRVVTIVSEAGWKGHQGAPQQSFGCHRECLDGVLGKYVPIL